MTTKKVPGVDDLGDVMAFGELKKDIMAFLKMVHNHDNQGMFMFQISDKEKLNMFEDRAHYLINKIESIGKKDGE